MLKVKHSVNDPNLMTPGGCGSGISNTANKSIKIIEHSERRLMASVSSIIQSAPPLVYNNSNSNNKNNHNLLHHHNHHHYPHHMSTCYTFNTNNKKMSTNSSRNSGVGTVHTMNSVHISQTNINTKDNTNKKSILKQRTTVINGKNNNNNNNNNNNHNNNNNTSTSTTINCNKLIHNNTNSVGSSSNNNNATVNNNSNKQRTGGAGAKIKNNSNTKTILDHRHHNHQQQQHNPYHPNPQQQHQSKLPHGPNSSHHHNSHHYKQHHNHSHHNHHYGSHYQQQEIQSSGRTSAQPPPISPLPKQIKILINHNRVCSGNASGANAGTRNSVTSSSISPFTPLSNENMLNVIPVVPAENQLQDTWTFWYLRFEKNFSWEHSQIELGTFQTVETFWDIFDSLLPLTESHHGCNYSLFKQGIRPIWEDPMNRQGGRFVFTINKEDRNYKKFADDMWLEFAMALIGNMLPDLSDQFCGIVGGNRNNLIKIAVWTRDCKKINDIVKIGQYLKQISKYEKIVPYEIHMDSLAVQNDRVLLNI